MEVVGRCPELRKKLNTINDTVPLVCRWS